MDELDPLSPASRHARRARQGRIVALAVTLGLLAAGYAILFSDFYREAPPIENRFQEQAIGATPPLDIYLELLSVDPVREAIAVRLDFSTNSGPYGRHFPGSSPVDLAVHVSDGSEVQEVRLQAGQPTPSTTLQLDVTGAVENYPLDQYSGRLSIRASQGKDLASALPTPVLLTTWQAIPGWAVAISRDESARGETGLALTITAHRPHAQVYFALMLYGAMVLIAGSALTIGSMIFLGVRKIEATLVSALAAMVFAVPALRNVLPGAPPLGVRADAFVFLWVQLAVILGLTLFVATWARRGPSL